MPGNVQARDRFTLIELLVVVTIIAILASLLLPALNNAKSKALEVTCIGNLKQHFVVLLNYAQDHDGFNTPVNNACSGACSKIWQTLLLDDAYLPLADALPGHSHIVLEALECPANENGYMPEIDPPSEFPWRDGTPNYMYNAEVGTSAPGNLRRLAAIADPAAHGQLFEGGVAPYLGTAYRCDYAIDSWASYFDPTASNFYKVGDVHGDYSNVLHFDGHVQRFFRGTISPSLADL